MPFAFYQMHLQQVDFCEGMDIKETPVDGDGRDQADQKCVTLPIW